jgi:hypothetical protein
VITRRILLLTLAVLLPLFGARIRLYLKGGGDLLVSEYAVQDDRVRYYSVERSAWEEIPLEFVDLEKTERVHGKEEARRAVRREEEEALRAAERKARTELHQVPVEDGVYFVDGERIVPIQQATVVMKTSKTRMLMKILSPLPGVATKITAELEGPTSPLQVHGEQPAFYLRLDTFNRIEIFHLEQKKESRKVQEIETIPESQKVFESQETVEIFRQQLAPKVYKIWPVQSLPPGEYAVVEYTPEEKNLRVWDFSLPSPGKS